MKIGENHHHVVVVGLAHIDSLTDRPNEPPVRHGSRRALILMSCPVFFAEKMLAFLLEICRPIFRVTLFIHPSHQILRCTRLVESQSRFFSSKSTHINPDNL